MYVIPSIYSIAASRKYWLVAIIVDFHYGVMVISCEKRVRLKTSVDRRRERRRPQNTKEELNIKCVAKFYVKLAAVAKQIQASITTSGVRSSSNSCF